MCASMHACVFHGMHVEVKRIICRSQFSLFTIWVLGIKLRLHPGLAASAFNPVNHLSDSQTFLKVSCWARDRAHWHSACLPCMGPWFMPQHHETNRKGQGSSWQKTAHISVRHYYAKLHKDLWLCLHTHIHILIRKKLITKMSYVKSTAAEYFRSYIKTTTTTKKWSLGCKVWPT